LQFRTILYHTNEGSIPFTRSIQNQALTKKCKRSASVPVLFQPLLTTPCLAKENRILTNHIKGRLRLTNPVHISLAQISQRLGSKALEDVASSAMGLVYVWDARYDTLGAVIQTNCLSMLSASL
jgi:hypothetical protein